MALGQILSFRVVAARSSEPLLDFRKLSDGDADVFHSAGASFG